MGPINLTFCTVVFFSSTRCTSTPLSDPYANSAGWMASDHVHRGPKQLAQQEKSHLTQLSAPMKGFISQSSEIPTGPYIASFFHVVHTCVSWHTSHSWNSHVRSDRFLVWDFGKKTCELWHQILWGVSLSDDYLCLIYAEFQVSPFSLYKGKGGKGGTESLRELTAGAEKRRHTEADQGTRFVLKFIRWCGKY